MLLPVLTDIDNTCLVPRQVNQSLGNCLVQVHLVIPDSVHRDNPFPSVQRQSGIVPDQSGTEMVVHHGDDDIPILLIQVELLPVVVRDEVEDITPVIRDDRTIAQEVRAYARVDSIRRDGRPSSKRKLPNQN